jgi:hypothetical protein
MVQGARGRLLFQGDHAICTDVCGFRKRAALEDPADLAHAEAISFGNGTND